MYTTDMYEGMIAETVTVQAPDGVAINAYFARPRWGPGRIPEWSSPTTCRVGMSGTENVRAGSRITVTPPSAPIFTTARAMPHQMM